MVGGGWVGGELRRDSRRVSEKGQSGGRIDTLCFEKKKKSIFY
jgi:general stress protein YciG